MPNRSFFAGDDGFWPWFAAKVAVAM